MINIGHLGHMMTPETVPDEDCEMQPKEEKKNSI